MNEDGNMNITADTANKASELRPDIDLNDPKLGLKIAAERLSICLLYTSPSPRDLSTSRMPSSA